LQQKEVALQDELGEVESCELGTKNKHGTYAEGSH